MGAQLKQMKGKPGMFKIRTVKGAQVIKLVEWKEDYVYDSVDYPAGLLPLGDQRQFFQNLANKQNVDTNLSTARRLLSGQEMILNQIGILVCHTRWDFTEATGIDVTAAIERFHYEFRVNNLTVAEGPVHCFPPGMGVTGTTAVAGQAIVTNGVASPAAVPRLLVPQTLTENNDIQGILTHHAAPWATYTAPTFAAGGLLVRNTLRGYVKTAVGKG